MSSVALAVTGISVGAGMLGKDAGGQRAAADLTGAVVADGSALSASGSTGSAASGSAASDSAASGSAASSAEVTRAPELSRGDQRPAVDPSKLAGVDDRPAAITQTRSLSESDPHDIAKALLPQFGFSSSEYGCLELLWNRESGWNPHAENPSGAYGIPQSLPGSKMASAGPDWENNPVTQIKWGLGYIKDRYGSPCGAWGHSQATGWY